MKKIWLVCIILIPLLGCDKTVTNSDAVKGNWNIVHHFQENIGYRSLFFVDQQTGWVLAGNGMIFSTTNGGTIWRSQNSGTSNCLHDIHFYDTKNGWAVGSNNTILYTNNGGTAWHRITLDGDSSQTLYGVYFSDADNGWIVSNHGKIYKTENSGKTWAIQLTWEYQCGGRFNFVNGETGYVIPVIGKKLYQTNNGGQSWTKTSLSNILSWESDIFFVDNSYGWICNMRGPSSVAYDYASVFQTTDGGKNWKKIHTFDERDLIKVYFIDKNNGWVAGSKIYYTSDGGKNWTAQIKSPTMSLVDLQFVDYSTGYAMDYVGAFYKFQSN